jgi:hypothetical protein
LLEKLEKIEVLEKVGCQKLKTGDGNTATLLLLLLRVALHFILF